MYTRFSDYTICIRTSIFNSWIYPDHFSGNAWIRYIALTHDNGFDGGTFYMLCTSITNKRVPCFPLFLSMLRVLTLCLNVILLLPTMHFFCQPSFHIHDDLNPCLEIPDQMVLLRTSSDSTIAASFRHVMPFFRHSRATWVQDQTKRQGLFLRIRNLVGFT